MPSRVAREGFQVADEQPRDPFCQPSRQQRLGGTDCGRSSRRFDRLLRNRALGDDAAGEHGLARESGRLSSAETERDPGPV